MLRQDAVLVVVTLPSADQSGCSVQCFTLDTKPCDEVDQSVEEYLAAHTTLMRVQASFPLYIPGEFMLCSQTNRTQLDKNVTDQR